MMMREKLAIQSTERINDIWHGSTHNDEDDDILVKPQLLHEIPAVSWWKTNFFMKTQLKTLSANETHTLTQSMAVNGQSALIDHLFLAWNLSRSPMASCHTIDRLIFVYRLLWRRKIAQTNSLHWIGYTNKQFSVTLKVA